MRRPSSYGWFPAVSALTWRTIPYRFSSAFFLILSLVLLVFARAQPVALSSFRTHVVDGLAPVLDAAMRPMAALEQGEISVQHLLSLKTDNQRLREENLHLGEIQNTAIALKKENNELRALLNFKVEPGLSYISARVIADTGGAYERGLIVTAGRTDGVHEGMAAMTGGGLIGRVVEVGDWSSRILLISDLNSRLPVVIAETGDRFILSGDNSPRPKLLFLPRDSSPIAGYHVVTSGHGGIFPPNLPVGLIQETDQGKPVVVPSADLGRITFVRLVDFDLKGGAFNPIAVRTHSESPKK